MSSSNSFARLPRTSLSADATQVIKELNVSGRLQPGAKPPSESELGETPGIRRPTVRESIRSLVAMNILVAEHGRGTYVASLDTEDLLQPLQFVLASALEALRGARPLQRGRALPPARRTPASADCRRLPQQAAARPDDQPQRSRRRESRHDGPAAGTRPEDRNRSRRRRRRQGQRSAGPPDFRRAAAEGHVTIGRGQPVEASS
jgi:DNA-binding transcriptional regulator YhcF (GntR family)